MKVLACIASYGSRNDQYLHQLIEEYSRMPYDVHVVVVSNIHKQLPLGVELRVGLPIKNPWSLPFAHRNIFIEHKDEYDIFIYSEDDTLITPRHVDAFSRVSKTLKDNEIAGFLRSEEGPGGAFYYSTIHRHYHWDPRSVVRRGEDTFAFFTNEHGACYILTREQLNRAIDSGGYSTVPHEGKYDMLVSAATDPYTQCGFTKLLCINRLGEFTCKHLSNKYVGRTGLEKELVDIQIATLLDIERGSVSVPKPIRVETYLPHNRWAKSYYEPRRDDLLSLVPAGATRILSIGCGWGKTEEALVAGGAEVTAIPLDVVIGAVARSRGVRVIQSALDGGSRDLRACAFDVVLIAGLLHLVDDPIDLLRQYGAVLAPNGSIIISVPNTSHLAVRLKRLHGASPFAALEDYQRSGVHVTSPRLVANWLIESGFAVQRSRATIAGRWHLFHKLTLGLFPGLWAEDLAFAARKCA